MASEKYNSHCDDCRHYSATSNLGADLTKTGKKLLDATCTDCNDKKLMIVNEVTFKAERFGHVFENVGNSSAKSAGKISYQCNRKS